ncbi:hypothetical protein AMTRI_Chr01g113570 [Amborella trichopoda]
MQGKNISIFAHSFKNMKILNGITLFIFIPTFNPNKFKTTYFFLTLSSPHSRVSLSRLFFLSESAVFIRSQTNYFLKVSQDIALGKDSKLFFKIAAYLWLISYEDHIDTYAEKACTELLKLYVKLDEERFSKIRKWIQARRKSE